MSKQVWAAMLAVAVMGALSACNSSSNGSNNVALSGAGSTFINPVMTHWTADFSQAHPNIHINYQSIGSGGGIQQVKAGTVDFGASDVALKDEQLAGMSPVVQIPETAGPVCITYNLPGLTQPLRLSPQALAGLFLGTIKSWKDPQLAKDNPGVKLPSSAVIISHRSDGSGTTGIFTEYLSAISPDWKKKVGSGTAVSWPTGIGGKGSEGVTGNIRNSPGAIGYVELSYAQQNNLPTAVIGNEAGKFVAATAAGTTADIAAYCRPDQQRSPPTHRQPACQCARCLSHLRPHLPDHPQRWSGQGEARRAEAVRPVHHYGWAGGSRHPQLCAAARQRQAVRSAAAAAADGGRTANQLTQFRGERTLRPPPLRVPLTFVEDVPRQQATRSICFRQTPRSGTRTPLTK